MPQAGLVHDAPDSPVRAIPDEVDRRGPRDGLALCLSGGAYRAMLFHLGARWRLNDAGLRGKLAHGTGTQVRLEAPCLPRALDHRQSRCAASRKRQVIAAFKGGGAATVTPAERVTEKINVRDEASAASDLVGVLRVGESAESIASVPRWYRIRLSDGTEGFVSKAWSTLITEADGPVTEVPFEVHFLDVGTGDAAIVHVGHREIVIDGGDSVSILERYERTAKVIEDPIELMVVTHADSDHWKGLPRLLGLDGHPGGHHMNL